MTKFADTARQAYKEAHDLLRDPEMRSVVNGGLTILYGPPIERPDLFLISFQGGGAEPVIYDTWPNKFLYVDDYENPLKKKTGNKFSFEKKLCKYAEEIGIYQTIKESTVAVPAVFPGAKSDDATKWANSKPGPKTDWRKFSVSWVERFVDEVKPKAIIVFGQKASKAIGLKGKWENVEGTPNRSGTIKMKFGTTIYRGFETVFCYHLSYPDGYGGEWVKKSLRHAAKVAGMLND